MITFSNTTELYPPLPHRYTSKSRASRGLIRQGESKMAVKGKIRRLIAKREGKGRANAYRIWKGYGPMGQHPHGWWIEPFGKNARWIGSSWKEIKKLW